MKLFRSVVKLALVNVFGTFILIGVYHTVSLSQRSSTSAEISLPDNDKRREPIKALTAEGQGVEPTNEPIRTNTPSSEPSPPIDTRCIIQIRTARYDVTEFRNRHSGGNIFTCNTDMTAIFFNQHSEQTLLQLEQYKL